MLIKLTQETVMHGKRYAKGDSIGSVELSDDPATAIMIVARKHIESISAVSGVDESRVRAALLSGRAVLQSEVST